MKKLPIHRKHPAHRSQHLPQYRQQGFTLMEALVSILILSLGALAMLGVQVATLAETQNSVRRAQAVRVIEDLAERIKSNSDGNLYDPELLKSYQAKWDDPLTPPAVNCGSNDCEADDLAAWDISQWRGQIEQLIPGGKATTFISSDDSRQLGVMLAWPLREGLGKPDRVTTGDGDDEVKCLENYICHLLYIQP